MNPQEELDLVAEIKTAYLNYAKSVRVAEIYAHTQILLEENLRVSRRLVENQTATADVIYRAQAELSDLLQKETDAENQRADAARYFNFLLNQPLETEIALDSDSVIAAAASVPLENVSQMGGARREELRQLEEGIKAASSATKISCAAGLPNVALAVDYGFQGNDYRFDSRNDMAMVSLVAQWNIFNGGQDASRLRQAKLETRRLTLQKEAVKNQIDLQIAQAVNAVEGARKAQAAASDRLENAKKSFEIVSRRYAEGMVTQVEYLDAQTNLTASGLNQVITVYDLVQKYVQLERATALPEISPEIADRHE